MHIQHYLCIILLCLTLVLNVLLRPIPHIVWDYVDTAALYDHVITLSL